MKGSALIIALLVTAVITTIAAQLIRHNDVSILKASRHYESAQLRQFNYAAIHWARIILQEDIRHSDADHLGELWATHLNGTQVEGYALQGGLRDEQSFYNLNNLFLSNADVALETRHIKKLLSILGLKESLVDVLLARRQKQQSILANISELYAWPELDANTLSRIMPYLTALPELTAINVNTASPETLATVVDNLSLAEARAFVLRHRLQPFLTIASLELALRNYPNTWSKSLGIKSTYFLLTGITIFNDAKQPVRALLMRNTNNLPRVVWRSWE